MSSTCHLQGLPYWVIDYKVIPRICNEVSYIIVSFFDLMASSDFKINVSVFSFKLLRWFSSTWINKVDVIWKSPKKVSFEFWHFPLIFVLRKMACLVTLFDHKLQIFKKSTYFDIFNEFLATQNIHIARFAFHVEWDILWWFSNIVVAYKMQCNTEKKISDILNGIFNL